MSRVLVIYTSHRGQPCAIAAFVADRLRARAHDVDFADACGTRRLRPPTDYDVVVLGSHVQLGHHHRNVLDYIQVHRDALHRMPTAFVSIAGERSAATKCMAMTLAKVDWYPTQSIAFASKPDRDGWLWRLAMNRLAPDVHEPADKVEMTAFANRIEYIAGGPIRLEPTRPWSQAWTN